MIRGTKLALASALVLGLSTAPAQAAEDFAYCDPLAPAGAALYSSTGAAGSALGRGGVVREPERRADAHRHAGVREGPGGQGLPRDRPRLLPRHHRRRDRRADERADRRADPGAQHDVRRRRGRRRRRLPLHARGRHADRQRGLVLRQPGRHRRALDEAGAQARWDRRAQSLLDDGRATSSAGPTSPTSPPSRGRPTSTASCSTGSRSPARRRPTPAATTRARRRRTRSATGSTSSTRSTAAAARRATSCPTRRPRRRRPPAARRARTPARRPGSTPSTTTWTTPTTPATRSSPPARCSGCATPGCCTARRLTRLDARSG